MLGYQSGWATNPAAQTPEQCGSVGELRLVEGYAPFEGRLEICLNTSTTRNGTLTWRWLPGVCRGNNNPLLFTAANARVACRQLQSQNWDYDISGISKCS